jgi:toxoflavin biosynthesis protein ToxD
VSLSWCEIPAGPFLMGSDPAAAFPPDDDEAPRRRVRLDGFGEYSLGRNPVAYRGPAPADELPQHVVDLPAFQLSLTAVTNAQYAPFVIETGADPPPHWPGDAPPGGLEDHPVTYVDWFDACRFCDWADGRLPTEAEWEKAARGADARRFPWGDGPDPERAAVGAGLKRGSTEPADARPEGSSPYGVLGMAGNVWEWVSSAYGPNPFDESREAPERVLRGGSFASPGLDHARCAMRSRSRPERRQRHIGFRVAR